MSEPKHIVDERNDINKLIKTMKEAEKIIKRDPDLSLYSRY